MSGAFQNGVGAYKLVKVCVRLMGTNNLIIALVQSACYRRSKYRSVLAPPSNSCVIRTRALTLKIKRPGGGV